MPLKPFRELVAASADKVRELMAVPRAAKLKAQAQSKLSDIEVEIITLESRREEMVADEKSHKDFDWDKFIDIGLDIEMLQLRKESFGIALKELFPEDVKE